MGGGGGVGQKNATPPPPPHLAHPIFQHGKLVQWIDVFKFLTVSSFELPLCGRA